MSGPAPHHISAAAYLIGQVLDERRRFGHPIPSWLRDLHEAFSRAVSANGHQTCQTGSAPSRLETTAEQAQRLGVSERTIRRRAAREGVNRTAGRYLFERHDA